MRHDPPPSGPEASPPPTEDRSVRLMPWRRTRGAPLIATGGLATSLGVAVWLWGARGEARDARVEAERAALEARTAAAEAGDTLTSLTAAPTTVGGDTAYLVVSLGENRLWYKRRDSVLFTTRVATGTGGELRKIGSKAIWKFDTPRGRLKVERKDDTPMWYPPDWHFVELAKKKKLRLVFLRPGKTIPLGDGAVVTLNGNDVVRRNADGSTVPYDAREGREIIVGRTLIVPPQGSNQRRFAGVLGPFRLYLGDGYGIHGTDVPSSIGRSASHGCIRVRNEDIEVLYTLVPVGTPVFVY